MQLGFGISITPLQHQRSGNLDTRLDGRRILIAIGNPQHSVGFAVPFVWHQVVWDVRDDLDQPVPNGLYRAHITARDSMENTLFEQSTYGYYLKPDAVTSLIGTTDSKGQFQTSAQRLFPGLSNPPVMTQRNASGDSLGTFAATDSTTLALRDELGSVQVYQVRLNNGSNILELTWGAPVIAGVGPTGEVPAEQVPGLARPSDVPNPPRPVFQLLGFRPNPFN